MSFKREERMRHDHLDEQTDTVEKVVCRDFKNGHCSRGERCIYDHPELDVCRDFQSGRCTRQNCRFLHIRPEVDTYTNSGSLPAHINGGQTMGNNGINGIQVGGLDFKGILGKRKFGDFDTFGFSSMPMSFVQENRSLSDLCRDFEKGECTRGNRCKYYHPKLIICRDFQKEKCEREKCRFLHMTREEEDSYEGSGVVPDHIDKEEVRKKRVMNPSSVGGVAGMNEMYGKRSRDDPMAGFQTLNISQTEQQLCRDFEKGECTRGDRCRYYHPKLIICRDFQKEKCEREKCRFLHMTREEEDSYDSNGVVPDHIDKDDVRKKRVMVPPTNGSATGVGTMYGAQRPDNYQTGSANTSFTAALEENVALKLKVTEMQKQVTDLRKMNDTLYEQNTNYRKNRKGS